MSTLSVEPLVHHCRRGTSKPSHVSKRFRVCSLHRRPRKLGFHGRSFFCDFKPPLRPFSVGIRAFSSPAESNVAVETSDVVFNQTFELIQTSMIEGKIFIKMDQGKDGQSWKFSVGCDLPGIWTLHWGVSYVNDVGKEWDQPPKHMIPPQSIHIKDYAIETPLMKPSSSAKDSKFQAVEIDFDPKSQIAAINFVLKDESTGAWYQHKGRDFKVPLVNYLHADGKVVSKKGFTSWTGNLGPLSNMLFKSEAPYSKEEDTGSIFGRNGQENAPLGFYEELAIAKGVDAINHTTVSVRKCSDTGQSHVSMETDLLGDVIVHWGVCRDGAKKWEIPVSPLPPNSVPFRGKASRTNLKVKEDGSGSFGSFTLEDGYEGFLFVLKQNENPWLNYMGNDFFIPLPVISVSRSLPKQDQSVVTETLDESAGKDSSSVPELGDSILGEMRNLMSGISSEKSRTKKTKGAQESLLKEIEKLAAEAYSMFRSSITILPEEKATEVEVSEPPPPVTSSGTGTGFEILCQGFNWESHKSGKWYMELKENAEELSSLGFTVIWLPPPTESVSPEGYMPKDLYNLNSRYGSIEELQDVVKKFHAVGIKVLGDVVLNHRCAHYQNQNGVWNMFGGRLNWDDRAVVADDPHFQGRGNKSSGDSFHAAPNIDHSQDFVRKDIKEWLCYLRKEIGYDGWRLDFVRGFWGGYVKDYLEASEPYFAVGEYWDSLSYTYGDMDHNQDAHRQRIVDWINAADGTAGAFDVTTKGILHAALEKCEYWRLSDQTGKPPGVLGWWPSRAVTFIENHDTGSTQGHWRFPGGKEMQGYAYILTHPGTPSVFYDHIFSHCRAEIKAIIALRNRNKLNCRSRVQIMKAERDVYAAIIDEKVAVKIGPGHYEPSGPQKWVQALEGRDYKIWEGSS